MFYSVPYFRTFCVIETIQCTYQITGDTADSLEAYFAFIFFSAAFGASITDDAVVAADGVAVNGMVDGAVTDALSLHVTDNLFESIQVCGRITIQFHISDMTCICQRL